MATNHETATIPGIEKIVRLRDMRVPIAEIARQLGVSRETIYKRLRKHEGGTASTVTAGIDTPGDDRKMSPAFYQSPATTETNNGIQP